MRFSTIRTGIATAVAAAALTACGGHGIVPSSGVSGDSFQATIAKATNPCYTAAVQPAWIFMGSCKITTLPTKGTTIKLAAYKGVTVSASLPANTGKSEGFVLVDALGTTDVSKYKGLAFPPVPKLKSVIYVEAVNAFADLKFTAGALVFTATSTAALPGTTCPLSVLEQKGTKFTWDTTPLVAKIKGKTLTYSIPYTDLGLFFPDGLPKGPLFFNVGCS